MNKEQKAKALELNLSYNKLARDIVEELKNRIEKSKKKSKHNDCKVIQVDVYDYTELGIVNEKLTFFDKDGYQYSLYADCSIEDLIDILTA
jgi:hypothetical protein